MMAGRTLVTVELRFITDEDPGQLADRMREAVATIVGKDVARGVPGQDAPAGRPEREGGLRPVE